MKKNDLTIALCNVIRPVFNVAAFEAEFLTKAFEAAKGDAKAFNDAITGKAKATAEALAKWTEENAEAVAKAEAAATPFVILNKVVDAKTKAEAAIEAKSAKVAKAKTDEAKANAIEALARCREENAEALALADALATHLAFISEPTAKAKAEALAKALDVATADNSTGTFNMYWDCQNTDGTRKQIETGVYCLPHALGSAEAAANCLLSYSVFAEADYRKAKAAEALENCLTTFEEKAEKYIEKGGYISELKAKFDEITSNLEAKAAEKAKALAEAAKAKFKRVSETEAKAEAAAKAADEADAKTAKGKKLAAEAAKAKRAYEAAITSWDVFKHDYPVEAAAVETPNLGNAA